MTEQAPEPQPRVWSDENQEPAGTGRTSSIKGDGEWRLVFQLPGEPHPGEWVEVDHPAVLEALGKSPAAGTGWQPKCYATCECGHCNCAHRDDDFLPSGMHRMATSQTAPASRAHTGGTMTERLTVEHVALIRDLFSGPFAVPNFVALCDSHELIRADLLAAHQKEARVFSVLHPVTDFKDDAGVGELAQIIVDKLAALTERAEQAEVERDALAKQITETMKWLRSPKPFVNAPIRPLDVLARLQSGAPRT